MRSLYVGLVHHPVLDRQRATVTTAITNLDLHDIARSARTYGCAGYFVTHPVTAQRELAERIRRHWVEGAGGKRIPDRIAAMRLVRTATTLDEAVDCIETEAGSPEIWVTSAQSGDETTDYAAGRARLESAGPPVLLVLGTGWGLADEVMRRATLRLDPVRSAMGGEYNHLSVRAAAAIMLDRLRG